jgi:hypothetical protein
MRPGAVEVRIVKILAVSFVGIAAETSNMYICRGFVGLPLARRVHTHLILLVSSFTPKEQK